MNIKRLFSMQRSARNTKNILAIFLVFFISLLGYSLLASPAQAISQIIPTMDETFTGSGLPMVSLTVFLLGILRIFFALLGVIALFLIIYGGFIWMTAAGDPNKVDKAKQIIYNTVIGLIIIFSAFAIVSFLMNFLRGVTGGGAGGINIPGGSGDLGRSAIGAGPIESVYPAPNQVNVPINTRIAVTFKQEIVANSICKDAVADGGNGNGICDNGEKMRNVSICEISATSSACLNGEFNEAAYQDTAVSQSSSTNFKTFIFRPNKYLGAEDERVRIFKVNLDKGITATSTGKSIFDGYRYDSYNWSFKTNGVLDFNPPEVAKFQIVPNPDNIADEYVVDTAATFGSSTLTMTNQPTAYHPVLVRNADNNNDIPYLGESLSNIPIYYDSGAQLSPEFKFNFNGTINSSSTLANAFVYYIDIISPDYAQLTNSGRWINQLGVNLENCPSGPANACLKIENRRQINTNAGFSFTATGDLPVGSKWRFLVTSENTGSGLVFYDGTASTTFVFVSSTYNYPKVINQRVTQEDGSIVTKSVYTIVIGSDLAATLNNIASVLNTNLGDSIKVAVNGNSVRIDPVSAGTNNFSLTSFGVINGSLSGNLAGVNRETGRRVKPDGTKPDPYNNSIFRISFTEAVLPVNIDNSIFIKINGVTTTASTTITNQYKTIELMGTHECGVNACGKTIYCWLDPNTNMASSVPASIEIRSARLRFCLNGNQDASQNSWCSKFGGTCLAYNPDPAAAAAADYGRCKLSTGLYYPQAFWAADNVNELRAQMSDPEGSGENWGIVDMAENSLNGNFDKAQNNKGFLIGNAQGRSGYGAGRAGMLAYYANDHLDVDNIFNYEVGTSTGDNFKWSFFISTQIDKSSPLLTKLDPVGNYSLGNMVGESFGQPVKFVFNTLMRMSTLKGGWGYGKDKNDQAWNIRYLILRTITKSANPVGYWSNSSDVDFDNDGLADYTATDLNHNPFDQSVTYGPLGGSGIESITQNCFLPGNGPQNAGDSTTSTVPAGTTANYCRYTSGGADTVGCVTDSVIDSTKRVTSTNPSSYGYMNCTDIEGAILCSTGKKCKVHWATSTDSLNGSWVITKDRPRVTNSATGETGCCFGKCY